MRKKSVILILALSAVLFAAAACNKSQPQEPPVEVEFSLDYHFAESGSMMKSGEEVYSSFYEKYVKTKQLAPKTFTLTFRNKETGAVTEFDGSWSKKHTLKLLSGEYEVTGTSHPQMAFKEFNVDSLYLCFDEVVNIGLETAAVNLTALYDSWMLMFNKDGKNAVHLSDGSQYNYEDADLKILDGIYYAFMNGLTNPEYNESEITIDGEEGQSATIYLNNVPFEKGKYYYFNDMTNSFDIPPMESGN